MSPSHQDTTGEANGGRQPLGLTRRSLLERGAAAGAAVALPGLAGVLSACGGNGESAGTAAVETETAAAPSGTVTVGSNYSVPADNSAFAETIKGFEASSEVSVEVNTIETTTFQNRINSYLQGRPDDVFTWFAGERMAFFAERGLSHPISDVWERVEDNFTPAFKEAATGRDGNQYLIPFVYGVFFVYHRKSLFDERGYEVPETWDDLLALSSKIQGDGLVPFAFGNEEGWPAMATFDHINFRLNGFDFHISLTRGEEDWNDQRVKDVFTHWQTLLPYQQPAPAGRPFTEAMQAVVNKEAAMYLSFAGVAQVIPEEALPDFDGFLFPEINPEFGRDTVEAPLDGFMLSREPENLDGAKELLTYLASPSAQETFLAGNPTRLGAGTGVSQEGYTALQLKAVEVASQAKHTTQYLDRDVRPDFVQTALIPAFQQFLATPDDIDTITNNIQKQKETVYREG